MLTLPLFSIVIAICILPLQKASRSSFSSSLISGASAGFPGSSDPDFSRTTRFPCKGTNENYIFFPTDKFVLRFASLVIHVKRGGLENELDFGAKHK